MKYREILLRFSAFWAEASKNQPDIDLLSAEYDSLSRAIQTIVRQPPGEGGIQNSSEQQMLFACARSMRMLLLCPGNKTEI